MTKYLNLEEVSLKRGETPFKVARMLTRKECKLFLDFREDNELLLCITEKMIEGNYHLFQVKKGTYPMSLKSQHECVRRLSNTNFDLSGLSFMVGKDEIRLRSVDDEDRSVCVVVHPDDVAKLPPPSKYQTAPVSMYPASPENKIFENFEGKNSSKRKGEKEDHTLIIWEAMQSLDNDLKKEAKPTMIWNYLRKNINKYNTNGVIISISHDVMKYFESNATEGHLTKESFRHAIKRLRENPPKKTVTCPDM